MKVGPFDGSAQEVRDLLENHGLKLENYLEKPQVPLRSIFLVLPVSLLCIILVLLVLFSRLCSPTVLTLIHISGFGCGTWLTVSTQLKFKNGMATFVVAIGIIVIILVASSVLSPKEAADFIKDVRGK